MSTTTENTTAVKTVAIDNSVFPFSDLHGTIGENAHIATVCELPNTVMLKFRNGESATISNNNLTKIGTKTGHTLCLVMVPNDKLEESKTSFIDPCNADFHGALGKLLEETKKVPSAGGSNSSNPANKFAKEVMTFLASPFVSDKTIDSGIEEIGTVVIKDGKTDNKFINEFIAKEEANKAKRIEALAKAREEKKAAKAAAAESGEVEVEVEA